MSDENTGRKMTPRDRYDRMAEAYNLVMLPLPAFEDFTCSMCPREHACVLAWDRYNTDGECFYDK